MIPFGLIDNVNVFRKMLAAGSSLCTINYKHQIPEDNNMGPKTASYPGTTTFLSQIHSNEGDAVKIYSCIVYLKHLLGS